MKKILTLPTVLVFLITILVAGGCNSPLLLEDCEIQNTKKVKIYLKATKDNHLKMYDSNDPTVVVDDLETCVLPDMKIIWKRVKDSGIRKIVKIGPEAPGDIMKDDAKTILFHKRFWYNISDDAPEPSDRQKYYIKFLNMDRDTVLIDPYLEIPPPS